ncbi:MAG: hypothetical protein ACOCUF_01175 [Patescibacteria group bacterium]
MNKQETILIKPHHFLDIIKLHGAGYEKFVPDEAFGHDFWRVGNKILEDPQVNLKITIEGDDICIPCKFYNGNICIDKTSINTGELSKDEWNKTIDSRLLDALDLHEGDVKSSLGLCRLARKKLNKEIIFKVWKEKPAEITQKRASLLLKGIDKYIENNSN